MTWDALIVGALWKCGHPKTPENTQTGHRQLPRCKECHRARARDYYERLCNRAREAALTPDPRALELGGEFVKARHRYYMRIKA